MPTLNGSNGKILVTSTPSVAFANEVTTADATYTTYTISAAAKRYWDPATIPTVHVSTDGGVTWTVAAANTYTVQPCGGKIKFNAAQAAATQVEVDGNYLPYSSIAGGKEWNVDIDIKLEDASEFGDTWKVQTAVQRSAKGKITKFWYDGSMMAYITNATLCVFVLESDGASELPRYEGYGHLQAEAIKSAVAALMTDDLSFEIEGELYYVS